MASITETEHAASHKNGIPEICTCWADCPCRKEPSCDPNKPLDPIKDMDGCVLRDGDYVKLVPVDDHACNSKCHMGGYLVFEYAAREVPKYPGCGGDAVERGDFYGKWCDETGLPKGHQARFERRKARDVYYLKHDIRIVGKARDPKLEVATRRAKEARAIMAGESEEVQKKYAAFNASEFEDGIWTGDVYDHDEFKDQLKAMRSDYYVEESDEYQAIDHSGFDSEEAAIDAFMGKQRL